MKLRPMLAGGSFWLAMLMIVLAPAMPGSAAGSATTLPQMPDAPDYQFLSNPSMEIYDPPYDQYEGADCQVASDWQRFWYDGPEPYWIDARVFADSPLGCGWVEYIDPYTSQMVVSTEPYTAGLWRQVGGLTPGVGYGFHTAMLTIFKTSDKEPVHGTMIKEVGLDPTGGTDPLSLQVVWSEPNDQDHGWDVERITAAYAQAPTATVFIRVTSPYTSGGLPMLNQSFFDSAILAQTAQVSATSLPVSKAESFEVRWDNAVPSPGGNIVWYDVQWLDEAEGVWHEWLTWTTWVSAIFDGQWGHRYRFRARAWQHYPNDAHLFSPYRAEGDTQTWVGPELMGRVLDPQERGLPGATVVVSETGQTAISGVGGAFRLELAPSAEPLSVTVSHPDWPAPPPVYDLTLAPTATVALTWTMRPPGDAVANGDFEMGLDGWLSTPGAAAAVSDTVHTGRGAALLTHGLSPTLSLSRPLTAAVGLSQTVALTDAWQPALSFWYRPEGAGEEGDFYVLLTIVTQTVSTTFRAPGPITPTTTVTTTRILTPLLGAAGRWHHFWSYVGPPQAALTGTVTFEFRLHDQAIYLDEVRLGATPGGPWRVYLPLVARGF